MPYLQLVRDEASEGQAGKGGEEEEGAGEDDFQQNHVSLAVRWLFAFSLVAAWKELCHLLNVCFEWHLWQKNDTRPLSTDQRWTSAWPVNSDP